MPNKKSHELFDSFATFPARIPRAFPDKFPSGHKAGHSSISSFHSQKREGEVNKREKAERRERRRKEDSLRATSCSLPLLPSLSRARFLISAEKIGEQFGGGFARIHSIDPSTLGYCSKGENNIEEEEDEARSGTRKQLEGDLRKKKARVQNRRDFPRKRS